MSLRRRIDRLAMSAKDITPPGQFELLVCCPEGHDPDGRAVGVYPGPSGQVVDWIFAGKEPDEAIMERLQAKMPSWGLTIVGVPDE